MINYAKRSFSILLIFAMSFLFFGCSFSNTSGFIERTVKTEYGDIFNLSFDSYKMTTIVQHSNSDFYLVFDKKIDEHDIIGIINSPDLKVYRLDDVLFYDKGDGFIQFDGDLSKNTHVSDLVRECIIKCVS